MQLRLNVYRRVIIGLLASATSAIAAPAHALECPQPQEKTVYGALQETQRTISERAATLKARGSAAIPSLISELRKSYPRSSNAEITNYLITAYCPVIVAKVELTENQKKSALFQFSSQVRRQLP